MFTLPMWIPLVCHRFTDFVRFVALRLDPFVRSGGLILYVVNTPLRYRGGDVLSLGACSARGSLIWLVGLFVVCTYVTFLFLPALR